MNVSEIKSVVFSIYDRDVVNDETIPLVTSEVDLNGSELYDETGQCSKCHPVTSYCRGHMGKILFTTHHISYMFSRRVKILLDMIHNRCERPVKQSSKMDTGKYANLYWDLVKAYDGVVCNCTGKKETLTLDEKVKKLEAVYSYFEERGTNSLKLIFNLDERRKVLKNYLLVCPAALLKQIHQGDVVMKSYSKLFLAIQRKHGNSEILKCIYDVYDSYMNTLKEKKGVLRKMGISRKIGNSARAVLTSDPFIGLEDIAISKTIIPSLSSDLRVTNENIYECAKMISDNVCYYVSYNKHKYRLSSSKVSLFYSECLEDGSLGQSVNVEEGNAILDDNGNVVSVYSTSNIESAIEAMDSLQVITIARRKVDVQSSEQANIGVTNVGVTNVGVTNIGPTNIGPTNIGPTNIGPTNIGPTNIGPTNIGPTNIGPTNIGVTNLDVVNKKSETSKRATVDAERTNLLNVEDLHFKESTLSLGKKYEKVACVSMKGTRFSQLFVEIVSKETFRGVSKIPLQIGCMLDSPAVGQRILVHRNPVLSADSIHDHFMTVIDNKEKVALTLEEKQLQRQDLESELNRPFLDIEEKQNPIDPKVVRAKLCKDAAPNTRRYKVYGSNCVVAKTIGDVNCSIAFNPLATTPYNADFDGDEINVHTLDCVEAKNTSLMADALKGSFGPIHDAKFGLYCISEGRIGLSFIRTDFAEVIAQRMKRSNFEVTNENLVAVGFSVDEAQLMKPKLLGNEELLSGTFEELKNFISQNVNYINYRSFRRLVIDFITKLRLSAKRSSITNKLSYNKFFVRYVQNVLNVETAKVYYEESIGNNYQSLISKFYGEIALCLYNICDYCGIYFSRFESLVALDVVRSGARPEMKTHNTIYDKVGYVSYPSPSGKETKLIRGNYKEGVSEDEFISLCFQNRAQTVSKGIMTAPEGDYMRLMSNFMSDISIKDGAWYKGENQIYAKITNDILASMKEKHSSFGYKEYAYIVDDDSQMLEYRDYSQLSDQLKLDRQKVIHWGQRKLLISEIDFLTDFAEDDDIVVYAGASPGTHVAVLRLLFPRITFELYDTSKFSSKLYNKVENRYFDRLKVCKKYLTPDLAQKRYGDRNSRVLYISDIRTNTNAEAFKVNAKRVNTVDFKANKEQSSIEQDSENSYGDTYDDEYENEENSLLDEESERKQIAEYDKSKPSEEDVIRDNELNLSIIRSMMPRHAMLKFRLPYSEGSTELPIGEVRLQAWSGHESTETRLICHSPYDTTKYYHTEHEQRMFYHNMKRPYKVEEVELSEFLLRLMGLERSDVYYDVCREKAVVEKYVRKFRKEVSYVYKCIHDVLGSNFDYYRNKDKRLF
jgi:Poly A polymerase regulatory subunit/RNA polymerase Rpb1, domain 2/Pentapeptide repeats (8 copies)